jgi:hypothetical protein
MAQVMHNAFRPSYDGSGETDTDHERLKSIHRMDPKLVQGKVHAFAQRLLQEADGDPVRALGLLVLVLDGAEIQSAEDAQRLVAEVRQVLMPERVEDVSRPVQHLAGEVSWEGIQHCLRCAKVLARNCHDRGASFVAGYVYEIGPRMISDECDDFESCA